MIGIDIVKISRIAEAMQKDRFLDKILNDIEIKYASKKSKIITKYGFDSVAMTVAGFFAAKEAVLKAIGVGMSGGFGFKDITIDHNEKGAPIVKLAKELEDYLTKQKGKSKEIAVSIAHDGEYATAMATLCL